jgi:hypothetical protein
MKTNVGIWIDHKAAVIVTLTGTGERIWRIPSHVEKQRRRISASASVSVATGEVPPDGSREREYQQHLARYYDEIISQVRMADEILILGPGEAKGELKKRFEKHHGGPHTFTLETADKLTEAQILARVRAHFHQEPLRKGVGVSNLQNHQTRPNYA